LRFSICAWNWLCVIVSGGKGARAQGQIKSDQNPRLEPTLPKFHQRNQGKRVMAKKKKAKKKSKPQ